MLAARDQENLVYAHQTNAAGKPLNQSIRGLQSKTPGRQATKTPFKKSGNDENNPWNFEGPKANSKAVGKGVEHEPQDKRQNGKLNNNAFVTPMGEWRFLHDAVSQLNLGAGPRARAPLGMKTTNAKARAVQTPAPLQQTGKPEKTLQKASTVRKSVKSKIRIAPPEPVEADILSMADDSDVAEIEYCPRRPIELPDPPIDITYDDSFPYLRGSNLCGGYSDIYDIPRDEHGVSLEERKAEEAHARMLQATEDKFRQDMAQPWPMDQDDDIVDAMIAAGPRKDLNQSSNVDTVRARGAISALSSQPSTGLPSAATKQTASSMQKRKPSSSILGRKRNAPAPTNPSPMRHTAAVAASKTTIGYSKGRSVSSVLPEKSTQALRDTSGKIDQSKIHPIEFRKLYGEPPIGSKMWDRLRDHGLFDSDDEEAGDADDLAGQLWGMGVHVEDEEEVFQLPMPEEM